MKINLVASDLDGTIIDKNNKIPADNFKAIEEIHNKNIDFVVCTGKSFSVSKNICKQFNASYGIFGNGTQIIDFSTGKEIFKKTLTKQDLLYIVTMSKRYRLHMHIYTDTGVVAEKLMYMDLRNFIIKTSTSSDLVFKLVDNIEDYILNNSIDVFSAVISSEGNLKDFDTILSVNKDIDSIFINKRGIYKDCIINKEYEYLSISSKNINKDEALNFLVKHLNISKKNIMAIGDNTNDLEMVKNSGIGVAVGDAYDELKSVAKYITKKTALEGGFAEAIFKYI